MKWRLQTADSAVVARVIVYVDVADARAVAALAAVAAASPAAGGRIVIAAVVVCFGATTAARIANC